MIASNAFASIRLGVGGHISKESEAAVNNDQSRENETNAVPAAGALPMKLEVVVIPVADVDRAKQFYSQLGWRLDADVTAGSDFRVLQFTPAGSPCSVIFGTDVTPAAPGASQGLHLIVSDVVAARAELVARGIEVSNVFHDVGGVFHHGKDGRLDGPHPERASYGSFASFSDPDGNGWLFQEITNRLPGRVDGETAVFSSPTELARALERAAAAHGVHEAKTGQHDVNWPEWYAQYIFSEHLGRTLPD